MSRPSHQDKPIRPRYGLPEAEEQQQTKAKKVGKRKKGMSKARKSSATAATEMASSYSEIPFLAQYPGAVPTHVMQDLTPTTATPPSPPPCESDLEDDDSIEVSEDGEDNKTPKRPQSLHCDSSFPYELEGATSTEGEMRHFVADNLEEKLRKRGSGSPKKKSASQYDNDSRHSTPSTATATKSLLTRRYLQTDRTPEIDANALNDIEIEAQYLAASVDNLSENLGNLLHSISSITADNVEVHKNAVNKLTDSMDANIKCMYTIMAKTEEITKSMRPTELLSQRIREIKRLVDMLDNTM